MLSPPPVVGGCSSCSGLGDVSTILSELGTALSGSIQIAGFAVPVWLIGAAGIVSAAMLMSPSHTRRYR